MNKISFRTAIQLFHEFTDSFCYFTLCFTSLPHIVNELELYITFTAGQFHDSERCEIIEEENVEEKDKESE